MRVDGVTVSNHLDTACQTGDEKLASMLDYRTGESWQRHPESGGFSIAAAHAGRRERRSIDAAPAACGRVEAWTDVAISEFAVDPGDRARARRASSVTTSSSSATTALDRATSAAGRSSRAASTGSATPTPSSTVAGRHHDRAGRTWVAALAGTAAADRADAVFAEPLDFLGAGVWIEDAAGRKVDSVGAYHANEMDFSLERHSPCSNGLSLPTFAPDRLVGETYQRVAIHRRRRRRLRHRGRDAGHASTSAPGASPPS